MTDTVALDSLIEPDAPICYGILMPGADTPGGVPVVKVRDFDHSGIDVDKLLRAAPEVEAPFRRSRLKPGDILLSIRGTTGVVTVVPDALTDANITQDTARVRVREAERDYIFQALHAPIVQRQIRLHTIGQAVRGINIASVRQLQIPWPPAPIRKLTARTLADCDRLIRELVDLIDAKRTFKRGLMQQLLTGRKRFPEFKGKGWHSARLGDVVDIDPESLANDTAPDFKFHYIDVSSVEDGRYNMPETPIEFSGAPSRARRVVRKNDVLMSTVRPNLQAFCRITHDRPDLICSTGFAVLRPQSEPDSEYVLECIFSAPFMRQVLARIAGSSFPAIAGSDVAELRIPWPESKERARIGGVLALCRSEIDQLEQLHELIDDYRRALLSRLLSGSFPVPA